MEALQERSRGRYKIVDQIGEGSLGAVYLARDLELGRNVALKTLTGAGSFGASDLEGVRRLFAHEASAASLLAHRGVVRIHDLVEEPDSAEVYLVMEYVEGASLAEMLARPSPIPFDFVVKTISAVADVLDHAHAHGVVHRDIKPANILVGAGGEIKVTDFGIADLRGQDLASDLQRAGSPSYMPPERVLGTGADHRGDIWSLGVVLYEMIARRLPFQGESVAELVTRIAAEEPPPLDAQGAVVVPGLQPIVDKALAKEPEDRYRSAGELAEELDAIQVGQLSLSATLPAASIPEVGDLFVEPDLDPEPVPAARAAQEPPSSAPPVVTHRGRWAAAAIGATLLWLVTLAGSVPSKPIEAPEEAATAPDPAQQRQRFEYLALLDEARSLIDAGENEAAAALFAKAEALSPDAQRIRALREEARLQAEREVAREVAIEVAALVGIAEADYQRGALTDAEDALQRALELDPEHAGARTLSVVLESARRAANQRARRSRRPEPVLAQPTVPAPPPVREPMRVEQPIRPPAALPAPTHSELKVDFYSELARGVVTVYREESQILRKPFRFLEKKGFMRSKGVSGGFDEQVRVPAGPTDMRVYLSLPGRETQVHRLSGILPPDAIRALQVRVDAEGRLSVELH